MKLLMHYGWPGNVRELENAIEHALVLGRGSVLEAEHFPTEILSESDAAVGERTTAGGVADEKEMIAAALDRTGWNRTRAARLLGIDRSTLWRKIKQYGMNPPE